MHKAYLIYGLLVIGLVAVAEYRGWTFLDTTVGNELPMPPSMRDNPAAYRTQFLQNTRYVGGK